MCADAGNLDLFFLETYVLIEMLLSTLCNSFLYTMARSQSIKGTRWLSKEREGRKTSQCLVSTGDRLKADCGATCLLLQ